MQTPRDVSRVSASSAMKNFLLMPIWNDLSWLICYHRNDVAVCAALYTPVCSVEQTAEMACNDL